MLRDARLRTLLVFMGACAAPATAPSTPPGSPATDAGAAPAVVQAVPFEAGPPPPPGPDERCVRDRDCVITAFRDCCGAKPPYAIAREALKSMTEDCGRMQCIDIENIEYADNARDFDARCEAQRCIAVEHVEPKKPKKKR